MPVARGGCGRDLARPWGLFALFSLVNPFMAGHAQTLQILLGIGAARRDWLLVMHQFCHHILPMLLAYLAKGVTADVSVPDLSPVSTVSLMLVIATGKVFVVPLHHLPMVVTVAALVVSQLWTATIPTWALWFHWHRIHLRP